MLDYPSSLWPYHRWLQGQKEYENWSERLEREDSYETYLAEIDSVQEIYTTEFNLSGTILDVGGGQGRLRHFLSPTDRYLSIDPWEAAFDGIDLQVNLLKAYPSLREPCNFLHASAEYLPLRQDCLDYVHMRSVLDHLFDPYRALLEARRVLRRDGGLMIGVHVTDNGSAIHSDSSISRLISSLRTKARDEGLRSAMNSAIRRVARQGKGDAHMWHPTYSELTDLIKCSNFEIEKVHWQKPPYDHVVYLMARKR